MDNAARTRQRVLAIFLPVTAVLYIGGEALSPKGTDQVITTTATALKVLPIAARHPAQLYVAAWLVLLGLGGLGMSTPADHTAHARDSSTVSPVQETSYLSCPEGRIGYNVAGGGSLVMLVPGTADLPGGRGLQPAGNVIPLVRRDVVARDGPRLVAVLNTVSTRLSAGSLHALDARVELRGQDPRLVPGSWLRMQGLTSMGGASR